MLFKLQNRYSRYFNTDVTAVLLPLDTEEVNMRIALGDRGRLVYHPKSIKSKEDAIKYLSHIDLNTTNCVLMIGSEKMVKWDCYIRLIRMSQVTHRQRCKLLPKPFHQSVGLQSKETLKLYREWLKEIVPIYPVKKIGREIIVAETFGLKKVYTKALSTITHYNPWCVLIEKL